MTNDLKSFLKDIKAIAKEYEGEFGDRVKYLVMQDILFLRGLNAALSFIITQEGKQEGQQKIPKEHKETCVSVLTLIQRLANALTMDREGLEEIARSKGCSEFVPFIWKNRESIQQFFDNI